jgi:death-on-curing protein
MEPGILLPRELNGLECCAPEGEAVVRTLGLAAGEKSEAAYAAWLERNSRPA